jgi:hypothetical protein
VRRATTVLLSTVLVTGGLAVTAPPAGAADIVTRDLTITVTGLGPEKPHVRDRRRPVRAGRGEQAHPGPGAAGDQRIRRHEGGPDRSGAGLRRARLRHALLHRPRLRRRRHLPDHARRPGARRRGRQPAAALPRRRPLGRGRRRRDGQEGRRRPGDPPGPGDRHPQRPRGRHDRRLLRRADPVRRRGRRARGGHGPAGRDHPADHLERLGLLPRPGEQRAAGRDGEQRLGRLERDRRVQVPVGGPVQHGGRRQRRRGHAGARRPGDVERLRHGELRQLRSAGLPGARGGRHPGLPEPGLDRVPALQLGGELHVRRPGAHPDRPGPGRHPVQPAGVGGDLCLAEGAGHAGVAGLAVVGPQRLHSGGR